MRDRAGTLVPSTEPAAASLYRGPESNMKMVPEVRVVHSYDTEQRRVRCGLTEQSSSTKHRREVTCVTCRGLLEQPQAPVRAVAWADSSQPPV